MLSPGLVWIVIVVWTKWDPVSSIAYRPFNTLPLESPFSSRYTSVIGDYDPDYPLLTVIQPQNQPLVKNLASPSVRAFDIPGNSTLHLKCTGNRELVWSFPQNYIVSSL